MIKHLTARQCREIAEWLEANPDWFDQESSRATSWADFNHWPTIATDREHLIMPGELFMVDPVTKPRGEFWVAKFHGKGMRCVALLSEDMRTDFGRVLNGYWRIPVEALQPKGVLRKGMKVVL